jgi:SAM-dependent methyltransferase
VTTTQPSTSTTTDVEQQLKVAMTAAWDHAALEYDDQWSHGLKTSVERDAWLALLSRLLPESPRLRVLDVGTGTGFLALLISELGHDVTGIDLSEEMMSVGREHARARKLTTRFLVGDAEAPPPLEELDVVISRHVFWTLQRPEQAVRAWSRMLGSGGRVVVIDGLWFHRSRLDRALGEVGRLMGQIRTGREKKREHHFPASADGQLPLKYLRSFEPARNVLVRAGLTDVLAEELAWIDNVERRVMPLDQRLRHRYTRYLLEGRSPD